MSELYCTDCRKSINSESNDHNTHYAVKTWAEFIGWQRSIDGDHFPLYNIYGIHRSKGSTVDANSLLRFGIKIPITPKCHFTSDESI